MMMSAASTPSLPPAMPAVPLQVLSTRLALPAAALWARLVQGPLIAQYLGVPQAEAGLAAALAAGPAQARAVEAVDPQGRPLRVTLTEAHPPCSLSLRLQADGQDQLLCWTVEALGPGSRLTVRHEPPGPRAEAADPAAANEPAGLLKLPPAAVLQAGRIGDVQSLALARDYLAGTAAAVQALLATLGPRQGYHKPAPDRFSLAEHLWHLADIESLGWRPRFERVLAEPMPQLAGVDGDRLAIEQRYQQRPWRGAARRFVAERRRSLALLARFDASTLARPLVFAGRAGDAGSLLAAMLAHDHEHRLEMAVLAAAPRGAGALQEHTR